MTVVTLCGTGVVNATASTVVVTLTEAVPAGDLIVLAGFTGSTTMASVSAVDSKGNTWDWSANQFSLSSSNGPFQIGLIARTALAIGDTVTLTFRGSAAGAGTAVSETRAGVVAAHITGPLDEGPGTGQPDVLDVTAGTTGTSTAPAATATTTTAPTTAVVELMAVRVGITSDADPVTAIPGAGWAEVGRVRSWAPSSGIQVVLVYRTKRILKGIPASEAFTLNASLSWRTLVASWAAAVNVDRLATMSDSLARGRSLPMSDTASTMSDSLVAGHAFARPVTDTVASLSDSLAAVRVRPRALADTICTPSDSLAAGHASARSLSDTAATVGDSLAVARGRARPVTDTAASISDSLATARSRARMLADTAAAVSDVLARRAPRPLADQAASFSDSITVTHGRVAMYDAGAFEAQPEPVPINTGGGGAGSGGYVPAAWRGLEQRTPALRYIDLADRVVRMSDRLDRRARRADPEPVELVAALELAGAL